MIKLYLGKFALLFLRSDLDSGQLKPLQKYFPVKYLMACVFSGNF